MLSGCPPPPVPRPVPPVTPPRAPSISQPKLSFGVIPNPLVPAALLTLRGEYAQLLFHINLRNSGTVPLTLRQLELIHRRSGKVLWRTVLDQTLLAERLRPAPWVVMRDRQSIAAAHRLWSRPPRPLGNTLIPPGETVSLVDLHVLVRPNELPDQLLCVAHLDRGQQQRTVPVRVYRQTTRLRLPIRGRWWVLAGHRFDEYHGQSLVNSQNFAYDFGVLGKNLTTFSGTGRRNGDYGCHDRPVLAAALGTVVEVHDGVAENKRVGRRPDWRQVQLWPRDIAGNFVVVRHADREYSAYLHLRPNIPVKVGQQVSAGAELGRCGNSGNSSEPHLHFQLQDGPDPLKARGRPARFSNFMFNFGRLWIEVGNEEDAPLPSWVAVQPTTPATADHPPSVPLSRWLSR